MLFIPDPGPGSLLFTHPGSRFQGSKKHWIPDPRFGSATLLGKVSKWQILSVQYRTAGRLIKHFLVYFLKYVCNHKIWSFWSKIAKYTYFYGKKVGSGSILLDPGPNWPKVPGQIGSGFKYRTLVSSLTQNLYWMVCYGGRIWNLWADPYVCMRVWFIVGTYIIAHVWCMCHHRHRKTMLERKWLILRSTI